MELTNKLSRAAALGILLGFTGWGIAQEGPAGSYQVNVTDSANLVWDLTSIPGLTSDYSLWIEREDTYLELWFERDFQQAGSGKLSGSGQRDVHMELWTDETGETFLSFPGTYKTSGSITSSRGICKVKMNTTVTGNAHLEGKTRRLNASQNASVTLNNTTMVATGVDKAKASASGLGGISSTESWSETLQNIGTGYWELELLDLVTTGNKITGSAQVTLHSGATHQFSVKGTYNAKKQMSKLVLTGLGLAKGGNLTLTIQGEDQITSMKGRIFGQMVNLTD
jgi:hypothetical protein